MSRPIHVEIQGDDRARAFHGKVPGRRFRHCSQATDLDAT